MNLKHVHNVLGSVWTDPTWNLHRRYVRGGGPTGVRPWRADYATTILCTYHKSTRYKVLPYQLEWLEKNVYHDGRRLSGSVRDKGAHRMMKAAFHNQLRTDTMEVAWLPQLEIAKWLVKQVKATKGARTVARKEAVGGGSEVTEDQPTMPKRARCGGQRAKEVGDAKGRKGKGRATIGKRKGGGGGGKATTKSKRSEAADDDGGGSGYSDEELPDFGSEEEDDMEEDE